jgi:hypothetical protein
MKKCVGTCFWGKVTGVTHTFVLYMLPVREILMPRVLRSFDVKILGSS